MMEDLEELVSVLSSCSRIDVKLSGLQYMVGLTGSEEGIKIITKSKKLLPFLAKLSVEDNEVIKRECFKIFINVLIDPDKSYGFIDDKFITFLINYTLEKTSQFADDAAKVLTNLTRNDNGCHKVLSCLNVMKDVSIIQFFDAFCNPKYNNYTELPHVGSFLSNLTTLKEARNVFLDRQNGIIQKLLPYTVHMKSYTRRAAAVRIIKNLSFETDHHEWLLSKEIDILPHLLLPLAGPEELGDNDMDQLPLDLQYLPSDKRREPDVKIRCMLLEALLQLCTRKFGRNYLKDNGTYVIMRELHKNEQNENVMISLEQLIQILIGDEPEEEMEDLKKVEIPENIQQKFQEADEKNVKINDGNS